MLKICVPTFFFLSGYLFFLNYDDYDIKWYVNKFRNRIKTLLVPYIVCNIVVFICFYIANFLFTGLMGSGKSYCMYDNIFDYLLMFWSPLANPVLWFIRDLFIVILLSPLMMPLVKKSRGVLPLLLIVLWFCSLWKSGYSGFSSVSFAFFYLGAWVSTNKIDFRIFLVERKWIVWLSVFLFLFTWIYCSLIDSIGWLNNLMIISGIITLMGIVDKTVSNQKLRSFNFSFWMPASFFIYAYHHVIHVPLKKFLYVILRPECACMNYVIFFVTVLFVITFLSVVYWGLKRLMPKYVWIFTGR